MIRLFCNLKTQKLFFFILLLAVATTSCKKFVDVDLPNTRIVAGSVFNDNKSAIAAVNGIYSNMISSTIGFASGDRSSITAFCALSADELVDYSNPIGDRTEAFQNALSTTNPTVLTLWSSIYNIIYSANIVMEGLEKSTGVTTDTKKQLMGEAKFIRAFCYFYLVNLYGDVPLLLTTDYNANALASRTSVTTVYQQIVADLLEAKTLLINAYPTGERIRANRAAATALLARAYLFTENWTEAETQATEVINDNTTYRLMTDIDSVYLPNSKEAIWQMVPRPGSICTFEGFRFILTTVPASYALSSQIVNAFETGDTRKTKWTKSITAGNPSATYYYTFKYKIRTKPSADPMKEYSMVMRLAEQYLIRAEARAKLNKLTGANSAASDINIIRNRSALVNTTATTQPALLTAIEQERKVELFTEWGHRWLDIKRTNRATAILGSIKSGWSATDVLYPIPEQEMNNAPNLRPQNPGY